MKVTPTMAYGRNLTPQNSKSNVSFGLIDPEQRAEVLAHLPLDKDPQRQGWEIGAMDYNKGVMVKYDESEQRVYADLIMAHVNASSEKDNYLSLAPEYYDDPRRAKLYACLDHLEDPDTFDSFSTYIHGINMRETRSDSPKKTLPSSSQSDVYEEDDWDRLQKMNGYM